jgi:sphingomyelin phosphodiesterase acid-like 3
LLTASQTAAEVPPPASIGRRGRAGWLVALLTILAAAITPGHARAENATGSFLHVSDIHFDPFATPGVAASLLPLNVDRWQARLVAAPDQTMARFGEDTNFPLLDSALAAMHAAARDVDFIIYTGDMLAHRFEDKAAKALQVEPRSSLVQAMAVETTIFVAKALARVASGRPVIIALGNNDAACGDYRIDPGGPYLAATRNTVRELLGNLEIDPGFDRTYAAGGYYAVRHPARPDITILVLNDVLWSNEYRDACGSDGVRAGTVMLDWLEAELRQHEARGRKVWLVHHIPIGYDSYSTSHAADAPCPARPVPYLRQPFADAFVQLIKRYSSIIDAGFAGHIHYDDFRLVVAPGGGAVAVEKIAPGISPIFGQNPGFLVFSYARRTGRPIDYAAHYLSNLGAARLARDGQWREEYEFTRRYGQRRFSPAAVATVLRRLKRRGTTQRDYRMLYNVSRGELASSVLPAYACAIANIDRRSFDACYCR